MRKLKYYFYKAIGKITKNRQVIVNYFRRGGAHIGNECVVCSNLDLCDKQCLFIGDNVVISDNVSFVTHDASLTRIEKGSGSLFGKISIGNNCFIGQRSIILYGVSIADDCFVGAGSVVTKSFLVPGKIIAGNPAKVIGDLDTYKQKYCGRGIKISELKNALDNNDQRLIKR